MGNGKEGCKDQTGGRPAACKWLASLLFASMLPYALAFFCAAFTARATPEGVYAILAAAIA